VGARGELVAAPTEGDGVTEESDPYADLKRHRWPDGMPAPPRRAAVPRKRRHFIKVPDFWVERLAGARHIATYRVALHLLYRSWRTGGQPVVLPNSVLAMEGVALRTALLAALKPHPEAARDVSRVLHELESQAAEQIKRDAANGKRVVPPPIEGEVLQ
jgi:hypothetical protein